MIYHLETNHPFGQKVLDLLIRYHFVSISNTNNHQNQTEKSVFLTDLKEAVESVKLHQQGKIQLQDAKEMLKELMEDTDNE